MIKDIPKYERPREKAIIKGIDSLSDVELLAILLRSGSKGVGAMELSLNLISSFNGLANVFFASEKELASFKGINKVKIIEIKSVLKIVEKINNTKLYEEDNIIKCGRDVYDLYNLKLKKYEKEVLILILLNNRNKIIKEETISIGNSTQVIIDRRAICKKALEANALKVILCHNHPTGNSSPSKNDIYCTNELNDALDIIDVKLLDHIIIGNGEFYSINDDMKIKI